MMFDKLNAIIIQECCFLCLKMTVLKYTQQSGEDELLSWSTTVSGLLTCSLGSAFCNKHNSLVILLFYFSVFCLWYMWDYKDDILEHQQDAKGIVAMEFHFPIKSFFKAQHLKLLKPGLPSQIWWDSFSSSLPL